MKKITIFMILVLQVLLAACNSRDASVQPSSETASDMTITFTLNGQQLNLRSNGDFKIDNLYLLICDPEQCILEKVKATLAPDGESYTAKVHYSNEVRYVHFVANYNKWDSWESDRYIGKDIRLILAGISTDKLVAWQKVELSNGITSEDPFNGSIELICNFAKFTLKVNKGLEAVQFAIYNYDKGTIAPFDPTENKLEFKEGVITVPHDAKMKALDDSDFKNQGDSYFTFERDNAHVVNDYSCMIVKGKYKDGKTYYYKVDLLNAAGNRTDICRNKSYNITINNIVTAGHESLDETIKATPDNKNFSLDSQFESFPSISDGLRRLSVDRSFVLLTNGNTIEVGASYYKRKDLSATWQSDNHKIEKPEVLKVEGYDPAVELVEYNAADSKIKITPKSSIAQTLKSKIRVKVKDGETELYRFIMVEVRIPIQLTISAGQVKDIQGSPLEIRIQIPETFPKELLPLEVHFKTNHFFPDDSNEMRFTVEDKTPVYTYILKTKDEIVRFRSNIGQSAETIHITAPNCEPIDLRVNNQYW